MSWMKASHADIKTLFFVEEGGPHLAICALGAKLCLNECLEIEPRQTMIALTDSGKKGR